MALLTGFAARSGRALKLLDRAITIHTGHMSSSAKPSKESEQQEMDLLKEIRKLIEGMETWRC
jgi:hypothetical protein